MKGFIMTRKQHTVDKIGKNAKKKEDTVDKTNEDVSTVDKISENASIVKSADEVTETETPKAPEKNKKKVRYHFPNASQCPRCRTYDTVATSTKGNKQYRTCRRGHCRHRYCAIGVKEK